MPHRTTVTAALAVLVAVAGGDTSRTAQGTPRIVAVADVHGSVDGLTAILRAAGLIDGAARWSGGPAHLVQTGDLLDRGADIRAVLDLLMRLEGEARRAGGRVDVLFGNHEGMNVLRDFRDVSPRAYAAFADGRSEDRRRRAFDAYAAVLKRAGGIVDRDAWMAAHPPGFVEYAEAMGPGGRYGRWLRARKVMLVAGETVFMHAGVAPGTTATVDEINRGVEREIRSWDLVVTTLERQRLLPPAARVEAIVNAAQVEIGNLVEAQRTGAPVGEYVTSAYIAALQHVSTVDSWALVAPDGPLWYRGLATLSDADGPALQTLLERYGARRFVLGHTPQQGRITSRLDGRVILADTGMLAEVYKGGQPSAVEIQDGTLTAIYPSGRLPLQAEEPAAAVPR